MDGSETINGTKIYGSITEWNEMKWHDETEWDENTRRKMRNWNETQMEQPGTKGVTKRSEPNWNETQRNPPKIIETMVKSLKMGGDVRKGRKEVRRQGAQRKRENISYQKWTCMCGRRAVKIWYKASLRKGGQASGHPLLVHNPRQTTKNRTTGGGHVYMFTSSKSSKR